MVRVRRGVPVPLALVTQMVVGDAAEVGFGCIPVPVVVTLSVGARVADYLSTNCRRATVCVGPASLSLADHFRDAFGTDAVDVLVEVEVLVEVRAGALVPPFECILGIWKAWRGVLELRNHTIDDIPRLLVCLRPV